MTEKILACPKCGHEQPEALECRRCGVIFSRLSGRKAGPASPAPAGPRPGNFFRAVRIAILLSLLVGISLNIWLTRERVAEWNRPMWVVVHPICDDESPETRAYVDSLTPGDFASLAGFFSAEAAPYKLKIKEPFEIVLAPRLDSKPPKIPSDPGLFSMILWSLKLRWWAWGIRAPRAPVQDIQLFVLYHDQSRTVLDHSYVMAKGYIGIVHAYAAPSMTQKNSVVMAHELLHLTGATDKYDPSSEFPLFPDGFADPQLLPRYPQKRAEIMAGSIPVSQTKSEMPDSLDDTMIGPATAREIHWKN